MKLDGNNLRNLIGWALVAALLLLLADQPVPRAATPSDVQTPHALAAGGKEPGKRPGPGNSEDNWKEVEAFMMANSTHKWEAYKNLPEAAQVQVRNQLIARYNELNRLSSNKPLHEIEVARVRIEDDLFQAMADRRRQHLQGEPYSKEYLDAVKSLIENRMEERKLRVQSLRETADALDVQVKKDEKAKNNPSEFERRIRERARMIRKMAWMLPPKAPVAESPANPPLPDLKMKSFPQTRSGNKEGSSPPRRPRRILA